MGVYGWHASVIGTFTKHRAYHCGIGDDCEMQSRKGQVVSNVKATVSAAAGLMLGLATLAYGSDGTNANAVSHVRGRTVFSAESPKVEPSVRKGYRFIGTQQVNLYGVAEAEQYLFARQGRDNTVESFYWIQFEHFLPSNDRTYKYGSKNTTPNR